MIKIRIRVRVRVGATFNVSVYHWSDCRRSKCRTFFSLYNNNNNTDYLYSAVHRSITALTIYEQTRKYEEKNKKTNTLLSKKKGI